jgi:hypothetical protein
MALYFSAAVWSSLALCTFALVEDRLPRYRRTTAAIPRPAGASQSASLGLFRHVAALTIARGRR